MEEIEIYFDGSIASNKNSLVTRLNNAVITYLRGISNKKLHDKSQTNSIIKGIAKYCRVTHTKQYKEWFLEARKQVAKQVDFEPLWDSVEIHWYFYFPKEGIAGGDITNKMQSIEDVLSACAVIEDDNYYCHRRGSYDSEYRPGHGGCRVTIKKIPKSIKKG